MNTLVDATEKILKTSVKNKKLSTFKDIISTSRKWIFQKIEVIPLVIDDFRFFKASVDIISKLPKKTQEEIMYSDNFLNQLSKSDNRYAKYVVAELKFNTGKKSLKDGLSLLDKTLMHNNKNTHLIKYLYHCKKPVISVKKKADISKLAKQPKNYSTVVYKKWIRSKVD